VAAVTQVAAGFSLYTEVWLTTGRGETAVEIG
jgi:hypothetical protein